MVIQWLRDDAEVFRRGVLTCPFCTPWQAYADLPCEECLRQLEERLSSSLVDRVGSDDGTALRRLVTEASRDHADKYECTVCGIEIIQHRGPLGPCRSNTQLPTEPLIDGSPFPSFDHAMLKRLSRPLKIVATEVRHTE